MVRLAARGGQVIGAASGCREIASSRIKSMKDRVIALIESSAVRREDVTFLIEMFESSLAAGQRAITTAQVACDSAERDFAALERSTPQQPEPVAVPAPQPQRVSPSTTAAITAIPATSIVRGLTEKEIRFGMAAALSGSAKELGTQMKIGVETAFNAANDAGGINGRQVKLIAADDGYEPVRTAEAMKQLYEKDQVFGIVGNVGTPTSAVALPYALERRMLFFGAFTGAGLLRKDPPDRYVFNYRASYAEETEAVVRYLVKVRRLKPEQIVVFAQQDSFGDSGFAGVEKAMRNLRGGDAGVIVRLGYKRNTVDVDPAIAQLKLQPGIRAVVMVATYRAAAKFIEKTKAVFPQLIYTNVSFVGSTALAEELLLLGPKFTTNVIVTQVVPAVNDYSSVILDYKNALAKYFPGTAPDYVSLEGYICASVLLEGVRRAGPQIDTEKLVEALESMKDFDMGLGALINYSRSEHQGSHRIWGTQLDENGKFQSVDLQ
ncbi:MAG: ABC transporter substrate-binding protein [Chitinophagales bacterium]|nr:ABC transporter substrate-binding protein [Hyphomicrobiales bacterium]